MMNMISCERPVVPPPDQTASRRYYGKYAGIVMENAAPDGQAHRGQIKVKVPGILEETPDGNDSQPIEVIAAPSFLPGFFFIPEQNVQVWVEFVAGDINYPIWTGVWYPNGGAPSDSEGNAPNEKHKIIRTPLGTQTAKGELIHLCDDSGKEQIVIKDEQNGDSGNTITLDKEGVKIEASASGKSVTLTFGQTTVVVKEDSITLTKDQSQIVVKSDSVEIDQGATTSVKLDSNGVTVSGSPTTQIVVGASGITATSALGASAGVVLAPLLDWLQSHQHVGNMGAPTPLFPADLALLQSMKGLMVSKV